MRPLVIRSAVVAAIGGLIFGFDTAVISGTTDALTREYALSESGLGFTVAIALVGTIAGAATAGRPADRYGRKKVLAAIGVLYVLGAIGSACATGHGMFLVFRFLGGVGVGASSVCAPVYTAEIAPAQVRGRLVGLVQFNIVLGILLAYLSNYVISSLVDGAVAWRWMLGVMAAPSVIFLALLPTVPETPRWLLSAGRREDAAAVSRRLCADEQESQEQLAEVEAALAASARARKVPFFAREHRKVITLAFMIAMFNQLSGINAVLYYAPEVMRQAGAEENSAYLMSVGVGAVNLVATMAALAVIDRFGRRLLMTVGSIGYIVSLGFLAGVMFTQAPDFTTTSSVLVLVGLMVFIAAHAFGQGAVIWVFISEIFPSRIRGRGQSWGSLTHWVFAALVTYAFPPLIGRWGAGVVFLIFAGCMVVQLLWVRRVMPETKGVPLEEMGARLGLSSGHRTFGVRV